MPPPQRQQPALLRPPAAGAPPTKPGSDEKGDSNDGALESAVNFAMQALYGNGAAQQVAKAIQTAKDKVEAIANTAYEMVAVVDEKTDGQVPNEDLVALAAQVLGEVVEIAQAAGVKIGPMDIAAAMKDMLLRYITEAGLDPTQLRAAMDKINPAQLNTVLTKAGA
jgi:ketopantoate reductase